MTEASKRAAAVGKEQKAQVEAAEKARKAADAGASTPAELKALLLRRYGNLFRAWKVVLDEDESVAIGLSRFSERVRAFGYVGDLKELFQAFQPDVHGVLTMKEWDARSHTLVTAFRSALLEKY